MGEVRNVGRESGPVLVCLEGNGARPSHKGNGWSVGGAMYTLNSTEVHCVCYRICSIASNSMKSSNPHSGIYQTDIGNTLDSMNCGYPACNQGGVMVVEVHEEQPRSGV